MGGGDAVIVLDALAGRGGVRFADPLDTGQSAGALPVLLDLDAGTLAEHEGQGRGDRRPDGRRPPVGRAGRHPRDHWFPSEDAQRPRLRNEFQELGGRSEDKAARLQLGHVDGAEFRAILRQSLDLPLKAAKGVAMTPSELLVNALQGPDRIPD